MPVLVRLREAIISGRSDQQFSRDSEQHSNRYGIGTLVLQDWSTSGLTSGLAVLWFEGSCDALTEAPSRRGGEKFV